MTSWIQWWKSFQTRDREFQINPTLQNCIYTKSQELSSEILALQWNGQPQLQGYIHIYSFLSIVFNWKLLKEYSSNCRTGKWPKPMHLIHFQLRITKKRMFLSNSKYEGGENNEFEREREMMALKGKRLNVSLFRLRKRK